MSQPNSEVSVGNAVFSNDKPFSLIAGPCQMESRAHAMEMAQAVKEIAEELNIGLVFKASYDKANRTSLSASRGMGMAKGLEVFAEIKETYGLPVITDVHEPNHCAPVSEVCDILQIPAYLCRQTDLLVAAAKTGRALNVKKGQFLAPWDMKNVMTKVVESGNSNVMLCERGATFGYNTLVSDMRALPIMADMGAPVVFDATHSVQQPGGLGGTSGGQREFVATLARAAVAVGIAGLFVETHDDPDNTTSSDGPNMIPLNRLKDLLLWLQEFDRIAKNGSFTL
ncbi:2-dehydro-3-deoxyphosphooctonate aldolase [Pseudovibrio sp. W64]|uniref:3-deoxy-8-phosphooctulonate synthase n=1 Tax=unclassified Pseudovibrio TaxID=2627060 RepID=UPI00070FC271|nr:MULTISPECIES: 3-deoxy-8-phosphooctulonate synthase [unclassified Pseudovibrio]KZK80258.1 2-dehydro-3-deoxyphosphooctonate aldolase [Pseudovibrio sp. W64]KZK83172.1 2-dehydro-3-deoxyphosphooctonate aldolase [Pseudovibrio sp. Ad13]KZL01745.1 2-dehydro-3-deoxyphosphooctonate aldolase [Pseudovibrio sp. Ad5]